MHLITNIAATTILLFSLPLGLVLADNTANPPSTAVEISSIRHARQGNLVIAGKALTLTFLDNA